MLKGAVVSKCGFIRWVGLVGRDSLRAEVSSAGNWAWRLGARLPKDPRLQWWWICRCWDEGLLQVGEEDRTRPGMAGAPAGDEDAGSRTKRTVSQQQRSFPEQSSISVFNSINSILIY